MTQAVAAPSKAFRSLGASLLLFAIATVGEFLALTGWYVLYHANPSLRSGFYQPDDRVVQLATDAGTASHVLAWFATLLSDFLQSPHPVYAVLVLWAGFVIERTMVVLWLHVPRLVLTPGGHLRRRWQVIGGITIAEIIVWLVWVWIAEAGEPLFAFGVLALGIHVVHAYEVGLIKHLPVPPLLADPGVVVITLLEAAGGGAALWLATQGWIAWPPAVMFGALLIEHILQVYALRKDAAEGVLR